MTTSMMLRTMILTLITQRSTTFRVRWMQLRRTSQFPSTALFATLNETIHTIQSEASLDRSEPLFAHRGRTTAPLLGKFPNGHTISNIDTVFAEIDSALGVSKPPDIELVLCDHLTYLNNPISKFLHLTLMRFGHLAIRYTTSDGQQHIMNIQGNFKDDNTTMVNFFTPTEYFYGTEPALAQQQGGPYNRPYIGLRIERVAAGATDALHAYFQALKKASEIGGDIQDESSVGARPGSSSRGAVRFQLVEVNLSKLAREVPAPIDKILFKAADWLRAQDDKRKYHKLEQSKVKSHARVEMEKGMNDIRQAIYHAGNCAQWASGGLEFVGLIRRRRLFPKAVLVDLFEDEVLHSKREKNVNVVYYAEIEHAAKLDTAYKCIKPAMVHLLKPSRNLFYHDMRDFASVIVSVPKGSDTAIVEKRATHKVPEPWLLYLSAATTYIPAAIMLGLVQQIGPMGPTAAALWLLAMWLLY